MSAPYERQLFVCTYGPWCRLAGSDEIRKALKAAAHDAGLGKEIRVTNSGCLGQCGHGPMAVMWPENVWYAKLTLADVPELVAEHVKEGRPVARLVYDAPKPGSNKTPEVKAKEAESKKTVE